MFNLIKKLVFIIAFVFIIFLFYNNINFEELSKNVIKRFYPIQYSECVEKYASEYGVDKYLIYAIIKAESNFNINAESGKQAKGLMQLMYSTAEEVAKKSNIELTEDNIYEPDININLGTKYISILIQKYENINLALAAYNAGSGNVDIWINEGTLKKDGSDIENIPYKETNNYVRKILRDYEIYKNLYE